MFLLKIGLVRILIPHSFSIQIFAQYKQNALHLASRAYKVDKSIIGLCTFYAPAQEQLLHEYCTRRVTLRSKLHL